MSECVVWIRVWAFACIDLELVYRVLRSIVACVLRILTVRHVTWKVFLTCSTSEHQGPWKYLFTEDKLVMTYLLYTLNLFTALLLFISILNYLLTEWYFCVQVLQNFTMKNLALYSAVAVLLALADSTYGLKKEDCEGNNIKHQGFWNSTVFPSHNS